MSLVNATIQARLQFKETAKMPVTNGESLDYFLGAASLSNSERYDVLYRFGPDMLAIPELSDVVLQYYCAESISRDFPLLCTLLDKHPRDDIANILLEATYLDDTEISWYFSRYGNSHPSFCYRLPAARALHEKLGWQKVQQYLPAWLHNGMSQLELQDVLGRVPLETFNSSLLEVYGPSYLADYPRSSVLLKLSRQYLRASGTSVFQREPGRRFLRFLYTNEKPYLPANFVDLGQMIDDRYEMLQFIEQPALMQDQLLTVFNKVPFGEESSWIKPLARALITCINYRGHLGIALSSISMVNPNYAAQCLFAMAKHVKIQTNTSNDEIWWRRTAILLEYALLPDLLPVDVPEQIITELLPGTNNAMRSYMNELASWWSPSVQDAARTYGLIPPKRKLSQLSRSVLPEPDSSIPSSLPSEEPISVPASVSSGDVVGTQVEVNLQIRIVKFVRAWLVFPWLLYRLWWLCRNPGTGRLARFWSDNSEILIVFGSLTPLSLRRHIQFACAFYNACQVGTSEEPTSEGAAKRLLEVINIEEYEEYLSTLTSDEIVQVQLAAKRIDEPLPPSLSSLSGATKTLQIRTRNY